MGRRGPKPEPAAVKLQKGSSRRPIGEAPAQPAAEPKVAAPAWLKGDGLKVWKRLAPQLIGMKLLARIDAETFARYCKNFARWHKMQRVLDREGETYESESQHGKLKRAHPAYLVADRLERQLVSAEANFGLNPAERQRLFAARAAALAGGQGELPGMGQPKPAGAPSAPGKSDSAVGYLQ